MASVMNLVRALVGALTLAAVACDGATSPTTSRSTSGEPASTVNVSGVWSGGTTDSLRQTTMTWQLTQTGNVVSGTVVATTTIGAPIYTGGSVAGSVSGTTFTFTVGIPRGSVADLPDCAVTLSGATTDITAAGMSGVYTGTDSCAGAIAGGRINFVKQ
jgi:hypothetical protein